MALCFISKTNVETFLFQLDLVSDVFNQVELLLNNFAI